ncbi:hypothetical protein CesoFtcFv8_002054 [Champsocephalus esox]|uniref:Uncharacterized protein n=1 Tax=Champsocephalus esox TaxID=159716 RepID=A0AAN8CX67_9TELE|nr:hypothetical protein CesoFtcFv8_002054 [Champsocephalus esox]
MEPLCMQRSELQRGDSADRIWGAGTSFTEAFVNCGCDVHIHHGPAACWVSGWRCIRYSETASGRGGLDQAGVKIRVSG